MDISFLLKNKVLIAFSKIILQSSLSMFYSHLPSPTPTTTATLPIFGNCILGVRKPSNFFISEKPFPFLPAPRSVWAFWFGLTNNFLSIKCHVILVLLQLLCFMQSFKDLLGPWYTNPSIFCVYFFPYSSLHTTILLFLFKSSDCGPFHISWGQTKKKYS